LTAHEALAAVFRAEHGRVLARLIGLLGDFDLAEEALADAYVAAARRWPEGGVPEYPASWLLTTARWRAIDRIRCARTHTAHLPALATEMRPSTDDDCPDDVALAAVGDDRLQLFFTCCHPALGRPVQVALTLRCLAGLSTAEVARLFLTSEATVSRRIVRAKRKIRETGIPFRVPNRDQLPGRLSAVLAVLYLMFTEGYVATRGPRLVRDELCEESIRLARALHELMPAEPEVTALLALLLLTDARRAARRTDAGELVPLAEQDRSRYDHRTITEGRYLLSRAVQAAPPGPYALQAAIAAAHADAPTAADTDWPRIVGLYRTLRVVAPSPMVELCHAIAVAEADGPQAGIVLLDVIAAGETIAVSHLIHATRADLLRRLGRTGEAVAAYESAIAAVANNAERDYLARRRDQLIDLDT
jgi:RNA polymerase sigma-70 factor, ECF subfamily